MKFGDVVQLKSCVATRNSVLMTVEDVRDQTVTCVYWRDKIICRAEISAHCLVVVPQSAA